MFRSHYLTTRVFAVCAALVCVLNYAPAQAASQKGGSFQYNADKISIRPNGARLDGNARITALDPQNPKGPPQLDVRAQAIAFEFSGSQVTQVRARGKVNIKINFRPKDGGANTRIEATSDEADLDPPKRELTLRGNLDGFYQVGDGPRTLLSGESAVLRPGIGGDFQGPIKITVPPETVSDAAIGTVTITSQKATFDQKTNVVRFVGNAKAISIDGPNKFDVAAPEMILTRGAGNTIDTLKTIGRTSLKIDLPPEPARPDAGAAPETTGDKVGRPTRVEVEADAATVNRTTSTLTFEGNVSGFYYLAPVGGQAQKYDFAGNKAVIKYIPEDQATAENPAGIKADITGTPGKPVEVTTPAFEFDLGG